MLAQAAFLRPERQPYFIYADEFATFSTESIASMLSELRKFGVGLVLAGQYTAQLERENLEAILGNVGNQLIFRLGPNDAKLFAANFELNAIDFMNLPNYQMFCRLMVDGTKTEAFSATTKQIRGDAPHHP